MKMIKSVVYLYKKSQWLVNGRLQIIARPGEPPGYKELLGRVNRFPVPGRFLGTGGPGEPPVVLWSGSSSFFRRFHGFAVRASSKPVANGSGYGTVSIGSKPVRFRVTRFVAITSDNIV